MREIIQPCKICGKNAVAQFQDGAPQDAVDKWLPMLTHDRCSDIRLKRIDSSERILSACFNYARGSEKDRPKIRLELPEMLRFWCRRYAEAIRDQLGLKEDIRNDHVEEFVQMLMEEPEKAARILSNYHHLKRNPQWIESSSND